MLLTDIVSILALLGFCICWFRGRMAKRDALLWASVSVALLASIAGHANYRGTAMIALVVALVLLLALVIRRLRGSRALSGRPWVSGLLFSLLTAIAAFGYWTFPIFEMPAPSGEHPVGVRDFDLTDTSRKGVMAAAVDEPRRLLVRVWYPAGSVAGLEPRPYFTDAEAATTWVFAHFRHVDTHSYENAPLLPGAERQPVVFFSHGYQGRLSQNTGLMEELASHGYIVYSVGHTYDGPEGVFPNGDPIPEDDKLWEEALESALPGGKAVDKVNGPTMAERRAGMIAMLERYTRDNTRFHRSRDVWIEDRLFVKDELMAGRVDPAMAEIAAAGDHTRVGHTGMSFGGSTAVSVCWRDADCAAVVNLDGGNFDPQLFNRSVDKPLLMFMHDWPVMNKLTEGDQGWDYSEYGYADLSYEAHSVAGTRDDIYRLRVKDVQHFGVTDMIMAVRGPVKSVIFGGIDGPTMMAVINDFVRGFFDKHVRGLDNNFPAAQFAEHSESVVPHDAGRVRDWWNSLSETERAELPVRPDVAGALLEADKAGRAAVSGEL
ncbi:MAG: hypothetical protein VYD68_04510 [Pseudomonadota bacterium]|nr:hypothetical protein [Pseudomonadota bacterium]